MMREEENDEDFPLQKSIGGRHKAIFRLLTETNNIIKPLCKIIVYYFQQKFQI